MCVAMNADVKIINLICDENLNFIFSKNLIFRLYCDCVHQVLGGDPMLSLHKARRPEKRKNNVEGDTWTGYDDRTTKRLASDLSRFHLFRRVTYGNKCSIFADTQSLVRPKASISP